MLLAALVMLTAGCGFHLRGSQGELAALPPVLVRGEGVLARQVQRALRDGGTPVVEDVSAARMVVKIGDVRRERRASAVNAAGRAQEYELFSSVRFRIEDPAGASLVPEQDVSTSRSFTYSSTEVNAMTSEEDNLYEDMQYDLVRQILMRVQAARPPEPAAASAPAAEEPAP